MHLSKLTSLRNKSRTMSLHKKLNLVYLLKKRCRLVKTVKFKWIFKYIVERSCALAETWTSAAY